jgi:Reverse transcriptase (RNA-dependent DNA polymerase)
MQTQHLPAQRHSRGVDSLQSLQKHIRYSDTEAVKSNIDDQVVESAFTISVTAALRDRRDEATPVIMDELQRMLDMHVWHGVHMRDLSKKQQSEIIPSKMFLKDKYLASGVFGKVKARLVAGGHQHDKGHYENISSPTAATSSVLAIAAIAAAEDRKVIAIDIGGAFLNADMAPTGVEEHMRLNRATRTSDQRPIHA